jgi:outer membrane protein TolC
VEVASDELESLRQEVAARVRETCAALLRNADEMKLHNEQAAMLNQALSAVLAEYTTGKVPQADVLRAQMALTRLNEHLIELEEQRDGSRAQLNELMGRSPDESVEIAGSYRSSETLPPSRSWSGWPSSTARSLPLCASRLRNPATRDV